MQCINPVILDVRGESSVTDYFVIVSGNSRPHLRAILEDTMQTLKEAGVSPFRRVTDPESGWLVLDYIDVVMHILLDDQRSYYGIEDLWAEAPRIG